jgi:hypothetical protein
MHAEDAAHVSTRTPQAALADILLHEEEGPGYPPAGTSNGVSFSGDRRRTSTN